MLKPELLASDGSTEGALQLLNSVNKAHCWTQMLIRGAYSWEAQRHVSEHKS